LGVQSIGSVNHQGRQPPFVNRRSIARDRDSLADGAVRFELVSRVNRLTVDEAVDTSLESAK